MLYRGHWSFQPYRTFQHDLGEQLESDAAMTTEAELPDEVHFVGSIGLDTVQEVFQAIGPRFGARLRRIPDGEPGGRRGWIQWQYSTLRNNPFLRSDPDMAPTPLGAPHVKLAAGVDPKDVRFGELNYAREARASYLDFCAARDRGAIAPGVRFQVCLPTPMAVVYVFCSPEDVGAIEPAYEAAMFREIQAICDAIPHDDLCIQWDVCVEMVIIDGQLKWRYSKHKSSKADIVERFERLGDAVAPDVDLGFHLCYGDMDAKHMVQPKDANKLVELANDIFKTVKRPITYIHFPVPINRTDDAYFKPLDNLRLPASTKLFLGVVHAQDGIEGTRKRIAAAQRHVRNFGIASECGIARSRSTELVDQFLDVYESVTRKT
jgi:hypothetical protein